MTLGLIAGTAHAQSTEQKVQGYVPPPLFGAPPVAQPRPDTPVIVPGRSSVTRDVSEPVATTGAPRPPVNGAIAPVQPEQPAFVKPRVSRDNRGGAPAVQPYIPKFPPLAPVPMEETPGGRGEIVDRPRAPLAAPLPQKKPPVPLKQDIAPVPADMTAATPAPGQIAPAPAPAIPSAPIQTQVASPTATPNIPVPPAASADKPVAAPAPAPVQTKVAAQPAYKVTSKGVVTGPKTMPSVGVGGVEKMETFTPDAATNGPTLLEQHAERQHDDNAAPEQVAAATVPDAPATVPAVPAGFQPVAQIEAVDASKSRMSLSFPAGQATLAQDQILTITHNIIPILNGDPGQRLQIQSYATAVDKGQSSDRRIALSRALAIRTALIEQGVEPRRIDVRALGGSTDQGPVDRVDLILSAL